MTFLTVIFALYLIIPGSNIVEIARYKDRDPCSAASKVLDSQGTHTFCMRTEREE